VAEESDPTIHSELIVALSELSPDEWATAVRTERESQRAKGFDEAHDDEHGIDHLLMWAQDYARRGETVKSGALIQAARDLLVRSLHPRPSEVRLHVSTHPDMETRTTLLNEGYEMAMAHHLADDPTVAQDWLDERDARRESEIRREVLEAAAARVMGEDVPNPVGTIAVSYAVELILDGLEANRG